MGKSEYQEYIRSSGWRDVKRRYRLSSLPQVCYVCGATKVDLHHKTYKNFGHERLMDLLPLCQKHHSMTHNLLRTRKAQGANVSKVNLWTAAKLLKRDLNRKGKAAADNT